MITYWLVFFPQLNSSRCRNSNSCFLPLTAAKGKFRQTSRSHCFLPQNGTAFFSFISFLKVSRALEQENFLGKPSLPRPTSENTKAALCHTQQCPGHRSKLLDLSTHLLLTPQFSHLLCHTFPTIKFNKVFMLLDWFLHNFFYFKWKIHFMH